METTPERHGQCLGLIGGLGVGATVHYYQELVKAHVARECVANLLIIHADVNRVLSHVREGEIAALAEYLSQLVRRLSDAGARIAAISAVTPHICAADLIRISPLPLVNLVEEVACEIRRQGLRRVALFGTHFTIETRLFGQLDDVEVIMPKPEEIDYIHETYFQIVKDGHGALPQAQGLSRIAHALCERDGAEAIVLAGTELALLFNKTNTDFPHIDCARLHLDAIMQRLLDRA